MSLSEYVTIAIVTGLVAAILMALLLGYGRRIGGVFKWIGWGLAIALVGIPAAAFFAGIDPLGLGGGRYAEKSVASAPVERADDAVIAPAPKKPAKPSVGEADVPTTYRTETKKNSDGTVVTRTIRSRPKIATSPAPEEVAAAISEDEVAALVEEEPVAAKVDAADEKFDTVKIMFGTDRNKVDGEKRISFGADRSGKLTLGQASVTIPKQHTRGIVERPWEFSIVGYTIYKQSENPDKHFTVQKIGTLNEDEFIGAANAHLATSEEYRKQAVIFVHGYNNDFDTALYRSAQMVYDMGFDGAPFLYSWPSAAGYSSYERDQQSARQSVRHLRKFIELVTDRTDADKIHLVAHSMGNDVLLEAMKDLRLRRGQDHDYKISQVILAAPDVDRNVFEILASQIAGMSKGMTLYASANDKALQASRTYAGGISRAGDVPAEGPVVLSGLDTIDVSSTQQDFWGVNHNTYAETSELLKDIKQIFQTGLRPPVKRTPVLEPVATDSGTYWRFPVTE